MTGSKQEDEPQSLHRLTTLQYFGRDALTFSAGTALLLVLSFVWSLIIPGFLPRESYGFWQLFRLYAGFAGLLHLGFLDGLLVRWAGKPPERYGGEPRPALAFLVREQLLLIVPLGLLALFFLSSPLLAIALMFLIFAFINNILTFFIVLAQALKKFTLLSVLNAARGITFLLCLIALFSLGYRTLYHVYFAFAVSFLIPLGLFALSLRRHFRTEGPEGRPLLPFAKQAMGVGIYILLGNFVMMLFMTADRWIVSMFFPIGEFAVYALAVSIALAVGAFVQALSQVFFPYMSALKNKGRERVYALAVPAVILCWAALLLLYFPLGSLVERYLPPPYADALPVLRTLLCTAGFASLIQILHVNYFKAGGRERHYFFLGITCLLLSILLNLAALKLLGTLESIAAATLLSFAIWYFVNEISLKAMTRLTLQKILRNFFLVAGYCGAFFFATEGFDRPAFRFPVYLFLFSAMTLIFLRADIRRLHLAIRKGEGCHVVPEAREDGKP